MKILHDKYSSGVDSHEALERLFELAVLLADSVDRGLAEQGLTRSRAEVIWRLQRGGPATQRELSDALRCTPRNVTGLVDALEASGLVARSPHPSDRRATVVSLTQQGRTTAAAWQADYHKLASLLFGDLAAADRTNLITALEQVLAKLRALTSTPPVTPASKRRQPKGRSATA
jgi:DNA-binding MarR family transcriptional regulator